MDIISEYFLRDIGKPRKKTVEDKSKSEKKREMTALQELGERLLELPGAQVEKIAMPQELRDSLLLARTLKSHSALRRQMQYIGALMRRVPVEPIRQAMDEISKGQKRRASEFQQLELMRDSLVEGDNSVFEEINNRFPDADIQKLRQMARAARKEKKDNMPPKQSRILFRYLRGLSAKN